MTKYERQLIHRILDPDNWPGFERPEFLDSLNQTADEAIAHNTLEGHLAALLIYQQLAEEMLIVLIQDHQFYIQLSVYPGAITFRKNPKATFGRLVSDLRDTVMLDESKDEITQLASELNQIRIKLLHGLTKIDNLHECQRLVQRARRVFDDIYQKFDEVHDIFRIAFGDFRDEFLELSQDSD